MPARLRRLARVNGESWVEGKEASLVGNAGSEDTNVKGNQGAAVEFDMKFSMGRAGWRATRQAWWAMQDQS